MFADAEIGFFHNETVVPEGSGVVELTVGVLAGELEEMVNISFSTDSASAIGRCNEMTCLTYFISHADSHGVHGCQKCPLTCYSFRDCVRNWRVNLLSTNYS